MMKPKISRRGNLGGGNKFDDCQSPPYVVDPLLPYLQGKVVWESASGLGIMADALRNAGLDVIETGLPEHDYFTYEPGGDYVQVTNPPYSIKYAWLERAYGLGRPFALLMPVEMAGADAAADLFKKHGVEILYLRPRVDFVMPHQEVYGHGAQFPVAWYCHGLLPKAVDWVKLDKPNRKGLQAWWATWKIAHQDKYWRWWGENAWPIGTHVVNNSGEEGEIVGHTSFVSAPYRVRMSGYVDSLAGWQLKELR